MQGADFARALQARFGEQVRIIEAPLMAPRFFVPSLPDGPFSALILTSQTGVDGYLQLGPGMAALPKQVFCVGARTADAARDAQLTPLLVADDAANLIAQIRAAKPSGKLLHLRGREARGNICSLLESAGLDTKEAVIYAQEAQALSAAAVAVLREDAPVLLPLFSPRSATLFRDEMLRVGGISPLYVAAMSDEIAREAAIMARQIKTAIRPDSAAMLDVLADQLADLKRA